MFNLYFLQYIRERNSMSDALFENNNVGSLSTDDSCSEQQSLSL